MKNTFLLIFFFFFSLLSAQQRTNFVEKAHYTISLNEKSFNQFVANISQKQWKYLGNQPCIIDFYTTWCGPCRRLAPVLEKLAERYDGMIKIYKIDAEKEPVLAHLFGVNSYPTLIFIPLNSSPRKAVGALPESDLDKLIHQLLLKK